MFVVVSPISAQDAKNHNFEVTKNLDVFNYIYKNLDLMYVDTLNPKEVVGTAIKAMLEGLDPYTVYYPENDVKELKMMLTGKYAGIGSLIRYHKKLHRVVIDEPYEGMPAAEAGLKKGDIIISIDDTLMTNKNTSEVSDRLRGDAGTSFVLKVKRPSTGKVMSFKITRRTIKMPAVPYYGMQKDSIGYINLNSFTEDCSKDVRRAFIDLKTKGARGIVLDLRNNGGGSVSEAVDIVNMFVPKGLTIVSTKGKLKRANSDYVTRLEPIDTVIPVAVLVNEETASASEITSGSLQDLDRGIILGTRTYGKGLV
jgi:carboxyl-terminal processing protease